MTNTQKSYLKRISKDATTWKHGKYTDLIQVFTDSSNPTKGKVRRVKDEVDCENSTQTSVRDSQPELKEGE